MSKKTVDDLFKQVDSRYALVNAVARRARDLATECELKKEVLEEKPVLLVLDSLKDGTSKIVNVNESDESDIFFDNIDE